MREGLRERDGFEGTHQVCSRKRSSNHLLQLRRDFLQQEKSSAAHAAKARSAQPPMPPLRQKLARRGGKTRTPHLHSHGDQTVQVCTLVKIKMFLFLGNKNPHIEYGVKGQKNSLKQTQQAFFQRFAASRTTEFLKLRV